MLCWTISGISHQSIVRLKAVDCVPHLQPRSRWAQHHRYCVNQSCPGHPPELKLSASAAAPQLNTLVRRSGNYHPSIWDDDFIQSLRNEFVGEPYLARRDQLKRSVKDMLDKTKEVTEKLEMINDLQRLGLDYHFDEQIRSCLLAIYNDMKEGKLQVNNDLSASALIFKLLRQHGHKVLPDYILTVVFHRFREDVGNFKSCHFGDIKEMLYLYESSFYLTEGETILEDLRDFTAKRLQDYVSQCEEGYLSLLASHTLEVPTHWRMRREEARWFIGAYETNPNRIPILLELAKLDFNIVQAHYQEDLKHLSRWWKNGCFAEKLPFARDRIVENFIWSVGMKFEPQFGEYRRMQTRLGALLTVLDDVYDVYGTIDELEQLTDAIFRWDVNAMDRLPEYMQMLFLSIYNFVNEMALDILRDRGFHVLPHLKKAWADLSKSYLLEAKWYDKGITPTLKDYLDNAWISCTCPLMLLHSFFFVTNPVEQEILEMKQHYPSIIRLSSTLLRLADDLGTASLEVARGDNPKSIQCYMHDNGTSEEDARKHINFLIDELWKKINHESFTNTVFNETFMGIARDVTRQAQAMYQYGDGHGVEASSKTKDRILSLFIQPISVGNLERVASN